MTRATLGVLALLFASDALGAELHVVHRGETVLTIAGGDASLADAIRAANGLAPGVEPALGAVLAMPTGSGHEDTRGELTWLAGTATARTGAGPAAPASEGDGIAAGDTLCTGANSFATIRLSGLPGGKHHEVNLFPETCVAVEALTRRSERVDSAVRLDQGGLSVASDDVGGDVVVRSAASVAVGTGGFRVRVDPESTRTEALDAPVAVFGQGAQVDLATNQGNLTRVGEAPGAAVDLLRPGVLQLPDAGAMLVRPDFRWRAVEGALGYRFEILSRRDGAGQLLMEDLPAESFQPDLLVLPFRVDGLYWRISSFDRTGLLGRPSDPRGFVPPPGVGP